MTHIYSLDECSNVLLRLIRQDDAEFAALAEALPNTLSDYSILDQFSRCNRKGVLKYNLHKTVADSGRSLALEAGQAFHDCAAALRLSQLRDQVDYTKTYTDTGLRLFGEVRFGNFHEYLCDDSLNAALLYILHSSDFYDDPRDTRRTLTNLEECVIAYAQHPDATKYPVLVQGDLVGIEQKFIIEATFTTQDFALIYYYGGRIDGIHLRNNAPCPIENKTGSRIDDAWEAGMRMTHQVTGYCIATSLMTHQQCAQAIAAGVQVPLPKAVYNGLRFTSLTRNEFRVREWLKWFFHNAQVRESLGDNALDAVETTASCNEFFRSCDFECICNAVSHDEAVDAIESLSTTTWNPWRSA